MLPMSWQTSTSRASELRSSRASEGPCCVSPRTKEPDMIVAILTGLGGPMLRIAAYEGARHDRCDPHGPRRAHAADVVADLDVAGVGVAILTGL
jgi:hypothetical protein